MDSCSLSFTITALAEAIAARTPDDDDLNLLSAALTQLGDTLATIAAVRAAEKQNCR